MAEPLRKAAGYGSASPRRQTPPRRQQANRARPTRAVDAAPRRLISRQVRSRTEFRHTIAWLFLGMSVILLALGFSYTYVKARVSRLNFNINAVRNENDRILLENSRIMGQIAELRSLSRIEEIATQELGMIKNESIEYMVLSSTIVAEGKIRATEEEAEEQDEKDDKPLELDAVIDFFLARRGK